MTSSLDRMTVLSRHVFVITFVAQLLGVRQIVMNCEEKFPTEQQENVACDVIMTQYPVTPQHFLSYWMLCNIVRIHKNSDTSWTRCKWCLFKTMVHCLSQLTAAYVPHRRVCERHCKEERKLLLAAAMPKTAASSPGNSLVTKIWISRLSVPRMRSV